MDKGTKRVKFEAEILSIVQNSIQGIDFNSATDLTDMILSELDDLDSKGKLNTYSAQEAIEGGMTAWVSNMNGLLNEAKMNQQSWKRYL